MKTFLLKDNKPIIQWSLLPDSTFYQGVTPVGYDLAVCPTPGYIIVDVDNKGDKRGSKNIPDNLNKEFESTFNYKTQNKGFHYWFKYTGSYILSNTSTPSGIDLRVGSKENNAGGYVKWHLRDITHPSVAEKLCNKTSTCLNEWLKSLF